ncbi:carbohydrate esterase family 16 protein [Clohesyomyces aquaticus]|uniref:Carbohydrate esterase family 16 protein n=1 Tax=Clohesyomyces aquaticus TaxID=1231657 RepID=A0A1Y1YRV5_9PLEO|nr:carbohydrate esterase family 16 protein [Clohesyomyces aquaticus]
MLSSRTLTRVAFALSIAHCASPAQAVNYFITFGDSYSQTGFNVSSTKPSSSNPLGNPAYPGWTTSGGPNWIGYLAHDYNSSVTYSYNFAYGGATVNASLVKPYQDTVKSFIDQVQQYKDSIAPKPTYAPWTPRNSLFGVWMGVNDVGNSYWNANDTEAALLGRIMDSYFGQIDVLYATGARNFVLLNVPPIDQSPLMLGQTEAVRAQEKGVIETFNGMVRMRVRDFVGAHEGVRMLVVDTQRPFEKAIKSPVSYGSKDASCYNADGKTCLWFNDYHPGQAIHRLVAEAVVSAWNGSFFRAVS